MNHEQFMQIALDAAKEAAAQDDVPVGAVVVSAAGQILSVAGNRREMNKDPTAHAEVLALREAAAKHGHWNLTGATLYATLEPCPMCAGALVLARIKTLVYGAADAKGGTISLGIEILQNARLNHRLENIGGICAEESKQLLQDFFRKKRISP